MEIFIDLFGKERIKFQTGRREFVGKQWLLCVHNKGIDFRMRIRETIGSLTDKGNLTQSGDHSRKPASILHSPSRRLAGCETKIGTYLVTDSNSKTVQIKGYLQ